MKAIALGEGDMRKGLILAVTLLLASCSSYEDRLWLLEKFVGASSIGSGSDVWLMKYNALGQYEKVGLIFGYMDDMAACSEIVSIYKARYPNVTLHCSFAN